MARTQEERNERRKKLFANELRALRQAEGHWSKAADAWGVENEGLAMMYQCRARCAESKAARCRSQQEFLNWEEDLGGQHHIRDLESMKDEGLTTLNERDVTTVHEEDDDMPNSSSNTKVKVKVENASAAAAPTPPDLPVCQKCGEAPEYNPNGHSGLTTCTVKHDCPKLPNAPIIHYRPDQWLLFCAENTLCQKCGDTKHWFSKNRGDLFSCPCSNDRWYTPSEWLEQNKVVVGKNELPVCPKCDYVNELGRTSTYQCNCLEEPVSHDDWLLFCAENTMCPVCGHYWTEEIPGGCCGGNLDNYTPTEWLARNGWRSSTNHE